MGVILEIATKNYGDDRLTIKKALSHMESLSGNYNGYILGSPSSRFGWTFFNLAFKDDLHDGIDKKFSDMISRYGRGNRLEKFTQFMADYFNSRGCSVKAKLVS